MLKKSTQCFSLFLIVWIGLLVRLNLPYREVWYDEAFTAKITDNSYKDIIKLSAKDVHPPLYYLIAKPFKPYIRVPSLIFGLGTIVMAYLLADKLTKDKNKSLLAGLVVAWNPFLVAYSNEARMYSMLAFLTLLFVYFFIKAWREGKYLGLAVTLCALSLTHYVGLVFTLVGMVLIFKGGKRAFIYILPAIIVAVGCFGFVKELPGKDGLKWMPPANVVTIKSAAYNYLFGYPNGETKQALFDRYFIGFLAVGIVLVVLVLPNWASVLYIGVCMGILIGYKPISYGYKDFANQANRLDRQVVMTDAAEYMMTSYYSDKIKLQDGDWGCYVVIKDSDIYDKSKGNFYLVNRGAIPAWGCSTKFNEYCIYEWN